MSGDRTRWRRDDSGLTMVELIVSSMLTIFMLTLVGGLFMRTMSANASVRATTVTSNEARLQFDSMQRAVRLAVETDVRRASNPAVVAAGGQGDILIVKTRSNEGAVAATSTWRCMGWYVDPAGDLHAISAKAVAVGGTSATATDPTTWPVVVSGVEGLGSAQPFLAHDPDAAVEAWYPGSVSINLHFRLDDANVPVDLSTTVAPRRQLQLDGEVPGGARCPQT